MPRYAKARMEDGLPFDIVQVIVDMQKDIQNLKLTVGQLQGQIDAITGTTASQNVPTGGG